jgi:hypothetical protein
MAGFVPFEQMRQRLERSRQDSDTAFFLDLLLFGEFLTKTAVSALVAAVQDDAKRYQQLHKLVRADGLGDWGLVAEEVLVGPSAQHLAAAAYPVQKEFTQRLPTGQWQYEAVRLLWRCIGRVAPELEFKLGGAEAGKKWFELFTILRNKTKGHGAFTSPILAALSPDLNEAISLIAENALIFKQPWAYLHRNLSGKYRVVALAPGDEVFAAYKQASPPEPLPNGVYIYWGRPVRLALAEADATGGDLFFPNGGFTEKRFELVSYISGEKREGDSKQYLRPPGELPPSETDGLSALDAVGDVFTNMPSPRGEYIQRPGLQHELRERLCDDLNRIVTLVGAGGIGKTSLTLRVLRDLCDANRFSVILWFSARDIDLLPDGPRTVKPQVLTIQGAAEEYVRLLQPAGCGTKGFDKHACMSDALHRGADRSPTLFVFDNFETVRSPSEMFAWVSEHLRLPNKALITTRHRDFRGDYPVPVPGMTENEAFELIDHHAKRLEIVQWITEAYRRDLYRESEGHPYVIKMLLGEVAKQGRLAKIERIVASRDDVLPALFERTFNLLSPAAQRVFLTLSSWRSNIPQLALEAVLLRQENERIDVAGAIEELERYSFIDVTRSEADNTDFLSVPLAAMVFGERKLSVSPYKASIEADRELLMGLGAGQRTDIRRGASSRIEQLFRSIANHLAQGRGTPEQYLPILEMIARKFPHAWFWVAKLHEELGGEAALAKSQVALRNYLESTTGRDALAGWQRLADLCRRADDHAGEYQALVQACAVPEADLDTISSAANRINSLLYNNRMEFDQDQRIALRGVVRAFEARLQRAVPDDLSRLAWLYLQLHEDDAARRLVRRAIEKYPEHEHLERLAARLRIGESE